jgi:hypothetical protein
LEKEKKRIAYKILLLVLLFLSNSFSSNFQGTGDSGKSTFIKQMSYLYGSYTKEDLAPFASVLRDNCLDGIFFFVALFVAHFVAMQLVLAYMQSHGGIPESLSLHVQSIQHADFLNSSMPMFPFVTYFLLA